MENLEVPSTGQHPLYAIQSPQEWKRYRKLVASLLKQKKKVTDLNDAIKKTPQHTDRLTYQFLDKTVDKIEGSNIWSPEQQQKLNPVTYWTLFHTDGVNKALLEAQSTHGLEPDAVKQLTDDATEVWKVYDVLRHAKKWIKVDDKGDRHQINRQETATKTGAEFSRNAGPANDDNNEDSDEEDSDESDSEDTPMKPENDIMEFVPVRPYHIKAHQRWWDDVLEESRKLAMGTASPDAKSKAKLNATFDEMVKKLKDYNAVNKVPENLGIVTFKTLYDYWASPHGVQKDQTRAQCVLGQVPLGWMDGENKEDYPTADQWRQEVDRLGAKPSGSHSGTYQPPTVDDPEGTSFQPPTTEALGDQQMIQASNDLHPRLPNSEGGAPVQINGTAQQQDESSRLRDTEGLGDQKMTDAPSHDLPNGTPQQPDESSRLRATEGLGDQQMRDAPSHDLPNGTPQQQDESSRLRATEGLGDQQMTDAPSHDLPSGPSQQQDEDGGTSQSNPDTANTLDGLLSLALQKSNSPVFRRITPKGKVFWTSTCTPASTDDIEPAKTLDGHLVVAMTPEKTTQKKAAIPRRKYVLEHKDTGHYFIQDESRCGGRTVGQLIAKIPVHKRPATVLTSLDALEGQTFLNKKRAEISVTDKGAMEEYGVGVDWVAHDSEMWLNPASKPYRICSVWWRTEERKQNWIEDFKSKSTAVMNRALLDNLINKHLADHLCARALGGYSDEWEAYRDLAGIQPALRGGNAAKHALTRVPHSQEALNDTSTERAEHLRSQMLLESAQSAANVPAQPLLKPSQADADDITVLKAQMKDLEKRLANLYIPQESYHGRDNVATASMPSGGARGSVMSDVQPT